MDKPLFLPVSKADMAGRGWTELDFLCITGDAYVDHPSFGMAIISRLLEKMGFRVGIIAQPDWRSARDFNRLGKPRLGVMITAGNLDSLLAHYTAAKHPRHKDAYAPRGKPGKRPDRATMVYTHRVREAFGKIPVIIGGIEASLRRFAHYDFWEDRVRRSMLIDARADILVYGMGEKPIGEIARRLDAGETAGSITDVPGTVVKSADLQFWQDYLVLPAYDDVAADKRKFAAAFKIQYEEQDPLRGKRLVQAHGAEYIIQNPPAPPLTTAEMDEVYDLPYARDYHPAYAAAGGVPAIQEVKFSIVSHRGCFGGCSFCALVSHQGRIIQARSKESILKEARLLTAMPDFKGYIHDVGGPTANFRLPACHQQQERGTCKGKQCLFPRFCRNLQYDHTDYLDILRSLRALPGVKKVFVRSGLRFDYLLAGNYREFLRELCEHHVSGQLKVAPEHVSPKVTALMGKSDRRVYERFVKAYRQINKQLGKEQYLVPYFMSGHPGCDLPEAVELAEFIRDMGYNPEQVQDFIPTPGSLSTCMYYTGLNPLTGEKVYVARTVKEKALQRALLQYRNPANYRLVHEALQKAGRTDLIGYEAKCLIRPVRNGPQKRKKGISK
ncbi:MAG TPA: YgiQ family radical SAM protein [Negativicutes bacterium]|nr:YgiQ family radical SAM protein [Negativicutes bacterium]